MSDQESYLEILVQQKRDLLPPIEELMGEDGVVQNSHLVLSWMGSPSSDPRLAVELFSEFPDEHEFKGLRFKTHLFDVLQLLSIRSKQGSQYLEALLGVMTDELLIVGSFHDDQEIARSCLQKLPSENAARALERLRKKRLSTADIFHMVEVGRTSQDFLHALEKSFSRYSLYDPDDNQISSFIKEAGAIKCSRLLYFITSSPASWPEFNQFLCEDDFTKGWNSFCYKDQDHLFERFSWYIQTTVIRVALLCLAYRGEEERLDSWLQELNSQSWGFGHDGASQGFERETMKLIKAAREKWITNGSS